MSYDTCCTAEVFNSAICSADSDEEQPNIHVEDEFENISETSEKVPNNGANLMKKMYKEALSVAEIENHKVDIKAQKKALEILMKPSSDFTSSMLRDLQSKKRTEHEHILGDLVRIGVQKKLDLPLLTSAYVNISIAAQGQNMAMDIE